MLGVISMISGPEYDIPRDYVVMTPLICGVVQHYRYACLYLYCTICHLCITSFINKLCHKQASSGWGSIMANVFDCDYTPVLNELYEIDR